MSEGVVSPGGEPPDPDTRRLLYEEVRHRHDVQRAVTERLEGKAALLLGADLALVSFVAKEPISSWWLPVALALYGLSAFAALIVVVPRTFHEVSPRSTLVGLWRWNVADAAGELANNRLRAIEANLEGQGRRVRCLRISLAFLVAGAMMSVLHLTLGEHDARGAERAGTAAVSTCAVGARGLDART